ncbi:PDZ domain-containing protein [Desulfallas sp. Bu1-1]|uniref:S41 family peptidase n=1 Tax=Desulfallas sp. Bu1-1 TaxID=2787620 RepID=UPI00189E0398|nr:S41 family peptidase [Desulfallas sp. Bu1-1]MBF7083923.1 PDZ domain-containing protein [Desulfallas sp. Bu1-1]
MSRRLVFLALTFLALFLWAQPVGAAQDTKDNDAQLIMEIKELIQQHHLSNPDPAVLTGGAIQGMLDSLDDPYTEYFTPEDIQNFTDSLNGDLVGVGIELSAGDQYPFVVRVIPGTPADRGGIKAGDLIVSVNGKSTAGRSLSEVVDEIRGVRDTTVVLTIRRGEKDFDLALRRADIHVPSVEYEMLAGGTGYISINSFGSQTAEEFESAIKQLMSSRAKSLIIDLRDNGGGYLQEAVEILDDFLAEGSIVVSIVDGRGNKEEIRTGQKPFVSGLPVVILVNGWTASASEIMAAALRDYGMATLVGSPTFGKGVVQSIIPLSSGGALKLTISKYLTPAGHDINNIGLEPDYSVLTGNLQKEVAWQILHPEDDPDLVVDTKTGKVLVNGRSIDLKINTIKRGNRVYLPLRPVLESMLYQVFWQDGKINIFSGQQEKLTINTGNSGPGGDTGIILEKGISYAPVDLLQRLNIDININGNSYILSRNL